MVSISLCMIARNEEKNLGRCLASVAGAVDEIIVVDTGSTDNTCQIARQYGARVQSFLWNDNFSDARNAALELATGDWVLVLDADEELAGESIPVLRRRVAEAGVEGYFMKIVNYIGGETGTELCPDMVFRLFRNRPGYRFHGLIHEQIADAVASNGLEKCVIAEDLVIVHYGYLDKQLEEKNKKERNLLLARKELALKPDDRALRYHYGVELHRAGQFREAAEELTKAANGLDPRTVYLPKLLRYIVISYYHAQMYEHALHMVDFAAKLFPDYADLYYYGGLASHDCQEYGQAYRFFEQALATPEQSLCYASYAGMRGFRAHHYLGRLAEMFCNEEEALGHYIASLRDNSSFSVALEAIVRILRPREDAAYARQALEKLFDFSSPAAGSLLVHIFFRQAAFPLALQYIEQIAAVRQLPAEMAIWQAICLMQQRRFHEARRILDGFTAEHPLYPMVKWNKLIYFWLQGNRAKVRVVGDELFALGLSEDTGAMVGLVKNSLGKKKAPPVALGDEGVSILMDTAMRGLDFGVGEQVQALFAGLSEQCLSDNAEKIGDLCYRFGHPEFAETYLKIAARQAPQAAAVYYLLAEIKRETGAHFEAEGFYRQAIALDPKQPGYYIKLTGLYETMRRQVLEQATRQYPEIPAFRSLLEEAATQP